AVTTKGNGELGHRFPQFLPDGRHFIYFVAGGGAEGVYVGSLDGGSSKQLSNTNAAVVSPLGFLLFRRQTTLFAQAFDFKSQELSGNPFPVAEQATAQFSAISGIVAYRAASVGAARQQLTWLDRSGKDLGAVGAPNMVLRDVELSPDGRRAAVTRS